jgi:hypothetical protein
MAKAAAYDQLKEGLVQLAVAESSARVQEQQPSRIEPPPSGRSAIASAENGNTCIVFGSSKGFGMRSALRRFSHRAVNQSVPCVDQGSKIAFTACSCDVGVVISLAQIPALGDAFNILYNSIMLIIIMQITA